MYALRIEATVSPGRCREFEDRMTATGELLKRHQGFDRGALLASTSHPTKYARMLRFSDRTAARAWLTSPELARLVAKQSPTPLFTASRPPEGYELIHATRAEPPVTGSFAHFADWTIDPAKSSAYEADRAELFDLRRNKGKGFVAMLLLRLAGAQGRYLMYSISTDEASHQATVAVPDVRAWVQAHPAAGYGCPGPVQETYDIVQSY
jgi:heme-degrading monooxygenase HmoA